MDQHDILRLRYSDLQLALSELHRARRTTDHRIAQVLKHIHKVRREQAELVRHRPREVA